MSIIKKFIFILFLATFANQVNAEEVKKMGTHKDWETYVVKSDTGKVCFAQSKPVLQAPKKNPREARLFISFRPGENIIDEINLEGIGTRPFFFPLHQQPVLKKYNLFKENIKLPNSELMSDLGFYIPSGLSLKEEEILKVSEVVIRIVTKYNQNFEV